MSGEPRPLRPRSGPPARRGRARRVVLGSRPARRAERLGRARAAAPRREEDLVPAGLRVATAYAWRLLLLGVVAYAVFTVLQRFQFVAIAVFVALVVTALLRPPADLLARRVPRPLAVVISILGSLLLLSALLSLVGAAVAGESARLANEFRGGVGRIEHWLERPPFHVRPGTLSHLQDKISSFLTAHRSTVISSVVSGAGAVVQALTGAALALFCSVFFIHSGDQLWAWFHAQLPPGARSPWDRAARAAWSTFAGYTRGILIVAGSNAVLVGIALLVLRVPLALPLTLLEFFASLIPLFGSPIAMAVATVVALAGRGPFVALAVLALIVIIGQIEGHVLHPLVMGWAVRLHPVVVALAVIAGSLVAGVIGAAVAVPLVSVAWAVVGALRTAPPAPEGTPPQASAAGGPGRGRDRRPGRRS